MHQIIFYDESNGIGCICLFLKICLTLFQFIWIFHFNVTIIIGVQKPVYYPNKVFSNHWYKCKYTWETTRSELSQVAFRSLRSLTQPTLLPGLCIVSSIPDILDLRPIGQRLGPGPHHMLFRVFAYEWNVFDPLCLL